MSKRLSTWISTPYRNLYSHFCSLGTLLKQFKLLAQWYNMLCSPLGIKTENSGVACLVP
uniref:Uncharacterized protein n=1 Tax=Anguilla anguilla TaxID=7936 RepID=A0A0E9UND1_ANGAN